MSRMIIKEYKMNTSEQVTSNEISKLKSLEKTLYGVIPIVCTGILFILSYSLNLGIKVNVGAIGGVTSGFLFAWLTISYIKSNRFVQYNKKAMEFVKSNDYQNAINQFEIAVSIRQNNPALHYNLAWLYSLVENKEKALLHLYNSQKYGLAGLKEKIEKNENLDFIKKQPEFMEFFNKLR
jgi:hypothetical protein